MKEKRTQTVFFWLFLALIGFAYMLLPCDLPPMGDDLAYSEGFAHYYGGSILYYPRWVLRHWCFVNGRLPNLLAPLFLHFMPVAVMRLCNGIFMALMLWLIADISGVCPGSGRRFTWCDAFWGFSLVAVVILALQWWDGFMLSAVVLNYVFTLVMVLGFVKLFFSNSFMQGKHYGAVRCGNSGMIRFFVACVFSFLAGMTHEASSLALLAGMSVWLLFVGGAWKYCSGRRRILLLCFVLGTAVVVFSPGILGRLASESVPDDTPLMLVLRSCYFVFLLLAIVAVVLMFSRKTLVALCHTPWLVLLVAAVSGLPVVAVGGIVGRSGMFAQVFALIALAVLLRTLFAGCYSRCSSRFGATGCVVVLLLVMGHLHALLKWQGRMGAQAAEVMELYRDSADGVVFYDYIRYDQAPWYVLGKVMGVPDEDDIYSIRTIDEMVGDSIKSLVVLPRRFACGITVSQQSAFCALEGPDSGCVVSDMPKSAIPIENGSGRSIVCNSSGREFVVVPFTRSDSMLYYIVPRVPHPQNAR